MEAAKGNRWGRRDATMVLVAYRHGLRPFELVATSTGITWDSWLSRRVNSSRVPVDDPSLIEHVSASQAERMIGESEPKGTFGRVAFIEGSFSRG